MSEPVVCAVCSTVNVVTAPRCIACGDAMPKREAASPPPKGKKRKRKKKRKQEAPEPAAAAKAPEPPPEPPETIPDESDLQEYSPTLSATVEGPDARAVEAAPEPRPREETKAELDPSPRPPSPPTEAQDPGARPDAELDAAALRKTVVEHLPLDDMDDLPDKSFINRTTDDAGDASEEAAALAAKAARQPKGTRFVIRLLLPESERRTVEVGTDPVTLGSGIHDLGLTGDPRAQESEARIYVESDTLYLHPNDDSANVYVRIGGEVALEDGDVILMGDIASGFSKIDPGEPVTGDKQALGGSASSACGRLTFLRRDGSPGPVHDLPAGKTIIGRTDGHLNFPQDSRLSRRHARFFASEDGVSVEDLDSRNGTYLRVRHKLRLDVGGALRIGSAGLQIRRQVDAGVT